MRRQALVGRKNGAKGGKGPRYRQIADGLLKDIASGKLAVGNLLLPEEDLSRIFKVSRGTLRQSLALLEDQGVILRRQRAGTKVLARFPGRGVLFDMGDQPVDCEPILPGFAPPARGLFP